MAGMGVSELAGRVQRKETPFTNGTTAAFFVNLSGYVEQQAAGCGAYSSKPFHCTDPGDKDTLKDQLNRNGVAVAMMTRRGFTEGFAGRGSTFDCLDRGDFCSESVVRARSKDGTRLPPLTELVQELEITNIVLVIDEVHLATNQASGKLIETIVCQKLLSQCDWLKKKYNLYVVGLSGTPLDRGSCPWARYFINHKMLHSMEIIRPSPSERKTLTAEEKATKEAELLEDPASVQVKFTDAQNAEIQHAFLWAREGDKDFYKKADAKSSTREQLITNPVDEETYQTVTTLGVALAVLPAQCKEDPNNDIFGFHGSVVDPKTCYQFQVAHAVSPKDDGKVYKHVSPHCVRTTAKDYLYDTIAAQYIRGHVLDGSPLQDLNPISPQMQPMRKVVRIFHGNKVEFRNCQAFPCVLLAVDTEEKYRLRCVRSAATALNETENALSHVFDMTALPAQTQEHMMKTKVLAMRKENKKLVIILVRASQANGACDRFSIADATIFVGSNLNMQRQLRHRVARDVKAVVGRILPCEPNGFRHYTISSPFAMAAAYDTKNRLVSVDAMGSDMDDVKDILKSVAGINNEMAKRLKKIFFKLGSSAKQAATPIWTQNGLKYRDYETPVHAAAHFLVRSRTAGANDWTREVSSWFDTLNALIDMPTVGGGAAAS